MLRQFIVSFAVVLAVSLSSCVSSDADCDKGPQDYAPKHLKAKSIIYVAPEGTGDGSSWASPLGDIQTAINIAEKDTRRHVWLKGGTFKVRNPLGIPDGVQVYGSFSGTEQSPADRQHAYPSGVTMKYKWDFASPTIIKWDEWWMYVPAVTFVLREGGEQLLDGVTITGYFQAVTAVSFGESIHCKASLSRVKVRDCGKGSVDGVVTGSELNVVCAYDCLAIDNSAQYGAGFQCLNAYRCMAVNNSARGGHGGGFRNCLRTYNCISVNNSAWPYGEQLSSFIHGIVINNRGYVSYQNAFPNYGSVMLTGLYSVEHERYDQPDYCLIEFDTIKSADSENARTIEPSDWPRPNPRAHDIRNQHGKGNRATTIAECEFVRPTNFIGTTRQLVKKLEILNADWRIKPGSSCENFVPRKSDCMYDWNGYKRLPMTSAGAFCSQYEIENQDKAGF